MARAAKDDFLQSFRFHVSATNTGGGTERFFTNSTPDEKGQPQAGFSAVSSPNASIDTAEYREGHYVYTKKQPGVPSFDDVTMSRGVTTADSQFYFWFTVCAEGNGEYRNDIEIRQFARISAAGEDILVRNNQSIKTNVAQGFKLITLFDAYVSAFKPTADLDANATEISLSDLTVAYESFMVSGSGVADGGTTPETPEADQT